MNMENTTPFSVKSPERLKPAEVVAQFVDHEAYLKLIPPEHTLIQGPRGTGKSMLFRYMSPAARCLANNCHVSKLPFIGIIVPVKQANVQMPEMELLTGPVARMIAENLLVTMLAIQVCRAFEEVIDFVTGSDESFDSWINILVSHVTKHVADAGYGIGNSEDLSTNKEKLEYVVNCLTKVELTSQDYLDSLVFCKELPAYGKRLLNYQLFLFPLFRKLSETSSNKEQTFYVLVDDADWLREEQTKVLNTWISFRTTNVVSFKAACQLDYKTFLTSGTRRIESPHDFCRVNLSTIYTHGAYALWVKTVVEKRLAACGIKCTADEFFPDDIKQTERLRTIQQEIESAKWVGPISERRRDDVYRYARPELIRRLGGSSKQTSTYLYCGFTQLVDISNATIRFFLEAASEMYARQQQNSQDKVVMAILPSIQNEVVRSHANELLHANFDEIVRDYSVEGRGESLIKRVRQVKNLVDVMGAAFYASLVHPSRSERRVLSFALQTDPDDELQEILRLAVSLNYFSESTLGKKEGFGRTRRYVLNRRISPYFNLDPSGFSGYFWVTSDFLRRAVDEPVKARDELRARLPSIAEGSQLSLPIADISKADSFLDVQEAVDEED